MEAHAKDVPENRTLPRVGVSGEMIAILAVGVMLTGSPVLTTSTGSWIRDDVQIALRNECSRPVRGAMTCRPCATS